ncbi:MAG: Rpn family recombination-promoting nuclease/putative transposase [Deltaproteobacteria bacterium]|nr:Rpn family recombination-promoting nuclease/putative transposase [Deltaproteobacteria bacterium]
MSNTPHDHLFKLVFSEPSELAPVLRALLPPSVAARLDLAQLSPAPTEQARRRPPNARPGPALPRAVARGGRAEVVFILEHQSSPDPSMPLRALRTTPTNLGSGGVVHACRWS